jgi:hypothetical protein
MIVSADDGGRSRGLFLPHTAGLGQVHLDRAAIAGRHGDDGDVVPTLRQQS